MTTRAELEADLAAYSKGRSEVYPITTFVKLATERIRREIMPQALDKEYIFVEADGPTEIRGGVWAWTVPTDLLKPVSVTNNGVRLRSTRPDALQEKSPRSTINKPSFHAMVGTALWVGPGSGGDLRMVYNAKDAALPASTSENYGLDAYYDAYLAAGMVEMLRYAEDTENLPVWQQAYVGHVMTLNAEAEKQRRGFGAPGVS